MISMSSIQKMMALSLKNSAEFTTLCTDNLNSEMNFYIDPSVSENSLKLPYTVIHKFNKSAPIDMEKEWVLQMVLAIKSEEDPIIENGISLYPSARLIELISDSAIGLIEQNLSCVGVDGDRQLFIKDYNILITEIGEADDIQAIVTIRLQKQLYI